MNYPKLKKYQAGSWNVDTGDGTPLCKSCIQKASEVFKSKGTSNNFKRMPKQKKLLAGKELARYNEKMAKKKARTTVPKPNQKHANPRFL